MYFHDLYVAINNSNSNVEYLDAAEHHKLPMVSIIIVNYNGSHWLKLFIPSLIRTRYPNFEIIVVDNASTDESVKSIRDNFNSVKIVELSENKGFADGINAGARLAAGDVLAFINRENTRAVLVYSFF